MRKQFHADDLHGNRRVRVEHDLELLLLRELRRRVRELRHTSLMPRDNGLLLGRHVLLCVRRRRRHMLPVRHWLA